MNNSLLTALINERRLDEDQAQTILEKAKQQNLRVDDVLYAENTVSEEEVAKARATALNIPYKPIRPDEISAELLSVIPADTAKTYRFFPISQEGNLLTVAAEYPDDPKVQEALRFIAKEKRVDLGVYVAKRSDVNEILKRYSPFQDEINAALSSATVSHGRGSGSGSSLVILEGDRTVVSGEAPIIKIVAKFLQEAVRQKASDIHLEPQRTHMRVRFRIDGQLREITTVPAEIQAPIISRVKIVSKLKIDETRVPQDGRFRTHVFDREIDFRIATFPTPFGEKIALRVLDPTVGLKGLSDLGIVNQSKTLLESGIQKPYGSILVTGPTGSGKTTTLYALMQLLNNEDTNIVSLEDPVEYSISGINQSQIKPEIGYTFASGLRQILRQDPDVIMIGEIRDPETAELATHAALTGHIVLATLHTNNALGVLPRMIDLGVEPFLLSSTVNLMTAQRLVRRLNDSCKEEIKNLSPDVMQIVEKEVARLPEALRKKYEGKNTFFRPSQQASCKGKEYAGRMAITEVFQMTPELSDVIARGISETEIVKESERQAMITMRQDGIIKALEGWVSIEEVLRETAASWS